MNKQKGFSLIELLIVVAIILIIAAIAIPNLLRSRMAANESSAAGSLRAVATANVTYSTTYNAGFAGTTLDLRRQAPRRLPTRRTCWTARCRASLPEHRTPPRRAAMCSPTFLDPARLAIRPTRLGHTR
jgi:prepilin-type N-terminal cleavage/methylation domain-containing protein